MPQGSYPLRVGVRVASGGPGNAGTDANSNIFLPLSQVAAPCVPPSSHELVVSDSLSFFFQSLACWELGFWGGVG